VFNTSATEFTEGQNSAIEYRRMDACVVAGPGSGKTTVLVERCRSLIENHGFDPREILAITFTEKAAANMKAKLAQQFQHDFVRKRELELGWVSTIHGFGARLLRENAIAAGIDPRFLVLDAREAEAQQAACMNDALDELTAERRADVLDLIEALQTPASIAYELINAYEAIRAAGLSLDDVRAMPNPGGERTPQELGARLKYILTEWPQQATEARQRLGAALKEWAQRLVETPPGDLAALRQLGKFPELRSVPETLKPELKSFKEEALPELMASALDTQTANYRALIFDVLGRFAALYHERKREKAALDFNDLERRTIELLERHAEVRDRVRKQFRQVLVDEFQDINQQQEKLIQLVRGDDVFFAVGDVNQSIYGFRHARPEIFYGYREDVVRVGKHSAELLDNFRSRPEILACVDVLLEGAVGIDPRRLNAAAEFAGKSSPSIEVLKVYPPEDPDDESDEGREARWITSRILALRGTLEVDGGRLADFGDFAVLFRANDSMRPLLQEFDKARIPYVCGRRQSFLLSREGLDITALLATIANPRDGIALATVLRSELVAVSDEALLRMRLLASSVTSGLNLLAHDEPKLEQFAADDAEKLARFHRNLRRWRAEQPLVSLDVLLVRALGDCGFDWTPETARGDNLESFLALARSRSSRFTLDQFLGEIESISSAMTTESDLSDEDQGNRIQVMTMHGAKGLEFPVTIIASLEKAVRRSSAPVTYTPAIGLGLRWSDTGNKEGLADSWQLANKDSIDQREKEEASRLLYVAMTRAEQHLILSYSAVKRTSSWVKLIEDRLGLARCTPKPHPQILTTITSEGVTFPVEARIMDAEPDDFTTADSAWQTQPVIEVVPRPVLRDQHDSAVNVTSLAVFAACPRKYYIERYVGWNGSRRRSFDPEELPSDKGTPAAELGSEVHEILAGKPGPHSAEAETLARVFSQSSLGRRAAASARQEREWEFIIEIGGALVRGSIDLWFEEAGAIHLVDYKTDETVRDAHYRPQLALYALAIERAVGRRPASASLHFLRKDVVVEVDVNGYDPAELVTRLLEAQDALCFDLNEGEQCRSCAYYRSLCPAGQMKAASAT